MWNWDIVDEQKEGNRAFWIYNNNSIYSDNNNSINNDNNNNRLWLCGRLGYFALGLISLYYITLIP